eukprot:scaffold6.g2525.t1
MAMRLGTAQLGTTLCAGHAARARPTAATRPISARRMTAIERPSPPLRRASATSAPPRRAVAVTAQSTAAAVPAPQGIKWGADLKKLAISVGIGAVLWLLPAPAGVSTPAWHLLSIFVATIVGIITQARARGVGWVRPLPLGAVAMLGLGATMVTKTLTFSAAFSAFANEIPWLIAIAFWLSGGFIRSGLGARIAYSIVSLFGKTTLGLTYSLVFAEALLAPAIPSVAARAGGLFLPLAKALCLACGSDPANGTEGKMGSYLMMTCFLTTTISSGMFITAMAANPLAVNLAQARGGGGEGEAARRSRTGEGAGACLSDNQAWDTLTWFAALIAMAAYLNKFGFIDWFSSKVVGLISGLGLSWQASFGLIVTLYFYSHYFFASGAAHIGAMYTAFLSVAVAAGTPAMLAALYLAQLSNVMGCLTTYGIGSAPPYYGAGYVPQSKWYTFGFLASILYVAVWLFVGGAWYKALGLW